MPGPEYREVANPNLPHLGGNIRFGDPDTFSPKVWDYVIDRLAIESVLDLGSGLGHASHYFSRKGLRVLAVEGMAENVDNAIYPTLLHDLVNGPCRSRSLPGGRRTHRRGRSSTTFWCHYAANTS